MIEKIQRILLLDERSLNSSSSDTATSGIRITTKDLADFLKNEIFDHVFGMFQDRCKNESPNETQVLDIAKQMHNDSENPNSLCEIINHLRREEGDHYDFAIQQLNNITGGTPPTPPSPLEQFSIHPLIPMKIENLYFSFTNSSLFMLLTLSLVLLLIHFVTKKGGGNLVPNAWQSLVELIYDFVLNLVNESWLFIYSSCINRSGIRCSITSLCFYDLNLYLLEWCYKSPLKWLFIYSTQFNLYKSKNLMDRTHPWLLRKK